jgi:hypothetical protein
LFRAGTILSGRREKIIFGKKEFRKSRGRWCRSPWKITETFLDYKGQNDKHTKTREKWARGQKDKWIDRQVDKYRMKMKQKKPFKKRLKF